MVRDSLRGPCARSMLVAALVLAAAGRVRAEDSGPEGGSILYKVRSGGERLEMTVNTSRILTLDQKIPQAQVNDPNVLALTALSPTQVQIAAKKPGITQVNLWDEQQRIYTVDVVVFGDARELAMLLENQFPNAALRVLPVSSGVLISGYVDQPEHVGRIIQIAEEFYPKVLNNITVGGVQQVLLHVKVMEVSRTKLRSLGFDWVQMSGNNIIRSSVSGLITSASAASMTYDPVTQIVTTTPASIKTNGADTLALAVLSGTDAFFGVLEALRQDNLMKVLSEPTLVTVSGRPAQFQVGGSFPILVPQSLGTVSIEYKDYGTQVDFVPIVLGNGYIRLEVRPWVSEIDNSRSIVVNGYTVPGLRQRRVDTGVEMQAGQTLAIAGLVQTRTEAHRRGVPWVAEVPYVGALFRRVREENNEIETLIMVTPELVDAMNACEVPPCGPGMRTSSPNDFQLYLRGHIEVPNVAAGSGACHACAHQGQAVPGAVGGNVPPMPGMIDSPPEVLTAPEPAPAAPSPALPAPNALSPEPRPKLPGGFPAVPSKRNNPSQPKNPPAKPSGSSGQAAMPKFMGPIGYDAEH